MWLIGGDGGSGDNDVMYQKLYSTIIYYFIYVLEILELKNTIHTAVVINV